MSYNFTDGIRHFAQNARTNQRAIFEATNAELLGSIKFGSARTGAPALPVALPQYPKSGSLRDSVTLSYSDPDHAVISTTKWFAPDVEDNPQGHQFVNGNAHGWKLTVAAFTHIVEANAKRIAGASGG